MTNSRSDSTTGIDAILTALDEIREVVQDLSARVRALEAPAAATQRPTPVVTAPPPVAEVISDDTLAVISAAVAAFLGKRAHVRQIRLITSSAWAQQGRVSVQASHRLER